MQGKLFVLYSTFFLFLGCITRTEQVKKHLENKGQATGIQSFASCLNYSNLVSNNTFLCDRQFRTWYGSIQGLSQNQTKELYVFGQCQSQQNGFDVIWVNNKLHKSLTFNKLDELEKRFEKEDFQENYLKKGFSAYFFRLPLKEVKDPLLDFPYEFPCKVEVYYNSGKNEKINKVGEFDVLSWEDYVQLQYSCLFTIK